MSYCRFSDGDVYAYETDGGVQFWVSGDNRELDRLCNTFYEAYRYAKELSDVHGLDVPSYAIEALREDALEEAKRISGVVGELQAENAKLRELAHAMLLYIDPASHQDTCGIECPAHSTCEGKSMCSFPDWAVRVARDLGVEVDA